MGELFARYLREFLVVLRNSTESPIAGLRVTPLLFNFIADLRILNSVRLGNRLYVENIFIESVDNGDRDYNIISVILNNGASHNMEHFQLRSDVLKRAAIKVIHNEPFSPAFIREMPEGDQPDQPIAVANRPRIAWTRAVLNEAPMPVAPRPDHPGGPILDVDFS